jgi:ABC-2 type transport system ATP-binding protein
MSDRIASASTADRRFGRPVADGSAESQRAPAVTLRDVSVRYGSRVALSHVTVAFPPGATGLLGPNGAGKSTLILAILGLVAPDGGRIEVLDLDVARAPLQVRARIGYAPEVDARLPQLDAVSSVAYCGELGGLPHDDALQRAHDVLSYVGLGESRYRSVETFSTGMKQRLKLAQALVHDPQLLLLDEPTNGMDPRGRDQMLALIRNLAHHHGLNIILSSHLLKDVEETCESVVVLDQGHVIGAGPIADWQREDQELYEVRIKGDEAAFVEALKAAGFECDATDAGIMRVVVGDASLQLVFAVANRLRVQIRHLRRQRSTLEDVFASITSDRA